MILIKRIEVVKMDKSLKRHFVIIAGIALVILGLILLLEYIWHFLRIFVGLLLVIIGVYLMIADSSNFRFRRYRI